VRGTPYRLSYGPEWSPDGSLIAFSRITIRLKEERFDQQVLVMNADGSGAHVVADAGSGPAWSPDGSRLAFLSVRDRNGHTCFEECNFNNELYVMNADGGDQRRLTRTRGDEENPSWSGDGARIAFDSDRNSPVGSDGGGRELYSIGTDGSCMTWLTNGGASSADPAWQPGAAGSLSDPGSGCGAVPRTPTEDIDVAGLGSAGYWVGPSFGGVLLSGVTLDGPLYTDCGRYEPRGCGRRFQLQNASICKRHPFWYGTGRGGGETDNGGLNVGDLPLHRFVYDGALVVGYRGEASGWDIYTGGRAVAVFDVGREPRDIKAVVRALRRIGRVAPRTGPLAEPRFPPEFWRKLGRFERVASRLGVAGAARVLRVTPRAVRDKLSLGRLLRREGFTRRASCS
jgi:hypothetical protein